MSTRQRLSRRTFLTRAALAAAAPWIDRLTKDGASARPVVATRRHAASGGDFEAFTPRLKALANRLGERRAGAVAFLADGAPCLWAGAGEQLPAAVLIQDYWHVCEHLHAQGTRAVGPRRGGGHGPALEPGVAPEPAGSGFGGVARRAQAAARPLA